jgi:hypothetical protein
MMTFSRGYSVPGLFQNTDRTFFATARYCMQKLWAYLYNRDHQDYSSLGVMSNRRRNRPYGHPLTPISLKKLSFRQRHLTSAPTYSIVGSWATSAKALDVDTEVTELVGQLIQALRQNSCTIPPPLQAEYNSIMEGSKDLHESGPVTVGFN